MNRREVYRAISDATSLPVKDVERVLTELGNMVINLRPHEKLTLPFCSVLSRYYRPKKGKYKGKEIMSSHKVKILFKSKFFSIYPYSYQWDYITEFVDGAPPSTYGQEKNTNPDDNISDDNE